MTVSFLRGWVQPTGPFGGSPRLDESFHMRLAARVVNLRRSVPLSVRINDDGTTELQWDVGAGIVALVVESTAEA